MNKRTLAFIATCTIAAVCLVWVLKGIDYREMLQNIERMHWGWVAFAVVTDILVYVFHGWRWSLLLTPLARVPMFRSVRAIYVGLFANEVLPFRTGEIIRCYLQAHWGKLPFSVALSSALIERIFDGLWLVVCLIIALQVADLPKNAVSFGVTLATAVLIGAVLLGAAMFWKESTYHRLSRYRYTKKIVVLLEDLHIIGHSRYLYYSGLASVPYLLMQVLPVWALARAYDIDLTLLEAFVVMVLLRFSAVVPQAPGNVGLFNLAAIAALQGVGVDPQTAKQFSVVLWIVITVPLLIVGAVALAITGVDMGELRAKAHSSMRPAK